MVESLNIYSVNIMYSETFPNVHPPNSGGFFENGEIFNTF